MNNKLTYIKLKNEYLEDLLYLKNIGKNIIKDEYNLGYCSKSIEQLIEEVNLNYKYIDKELPTEFLKKWYLLSYKIYNNRKNGNFKNDTLLLERHILYLKLIKNIFS